MIRDVRLGGCPRWLIDIPKGADVRIHESMLSCVVFVGRIFKKGTVEESRLIGTAFIVSVPQLTAQVRFMYLVTARHVAEMLVSGGKWFIRFNNQDGAIEEVL